MEKNVKKLSGIKLNQLSKNELTEKQMNVLKGGSSCCCRCTSSEGNACSNTDNKTGESAASTF